MGTELRSELKSRNLAMHGQGKLLTPAILCIEHKILTGYCPFAASTFRSTEREGTARVSASTRAAIGHFLRRGKITARARPVCSDRANLSAETSHLWRAWICAHLLWFCRNDPRSGPVKHETQRKQFIALIVHFICENPCSGIELFSHRVSYFLNRHWGAPWNSSLILRGHGEQFTHERGNGMVLRAVHNSCSLKYLYSMHIR